MTWTIVFTESVIVLKIMIMSIKTSVPFRCSRRLPHIMGSDIVVLLQVLGVSPQVYIALHTSESQCG